MQPKKYAIYTAMVGGYDEIFALEDVIDRRIIYNKIKIC